MEVQPQLVLLQKTLFNIEGLGRQLYPDLDLWQTAKPFLERWLRQQIGLRALLRKTHKYAPYWAEKLPDLPDLLYQTLTELQVKNRQQKTRQLTKKKALEKWRKYYRSGWQLGIGCALLVWVILNNLPLHLQWMRLEIVNWLATIAGLLLILRAKWFSSD